MSIAFLINIIRKEDCQVDICRFYNGSIFNAYEYLGAHITKKGTIFRTYAPNAESISLVGDFNGWKDMPMKKTDDGNFYEIICSAAKEGMRYKYRIYTSKTEFIDHADPYGFSAELRPGTCSVIRSLSYKFSDEKWLKERTDCKIKPLNIYEIHLGSWKKPESEKNRVEWYNYSEIADMLIDYVIENGFNYIEFMPLAEHPCDESWGYQITGFFAPTSRYGTPVQLMELVDKCHQKGIGVIMDFVPVHFAVDHYGLTEYDGTKLYEYPSDDIGYNEWGSRNFMHSKGEVQSFLQSAANYWLDVYHFDGLRMDAIRNMIYWNGDESRGENKTAMEFLKKMNSGLKMRHPTAIIAAEDSSAYPNVTKPVSMGGLGFDYKWDMGWMHDTLEYLQTSPMYRSRDYYKLAFSMQYFYNENYILPLSHDEVVHGKATIVQKMHGDYERKFPQAKLLYMYMAVHPGKMLNFMGSEFGQLREWDEKREQDWDMLKYPLHDSFREFVRAINRLYLNCTALHYDYDPLNFEWVDCKSVDRCIYAIRRKSGTGDVLAILNFSDWKHSGYKVKIGEDYRERILIDTDWNSFSGDTHDAETEYIRTKDSLIMDVQPFSGKMFFLKHKPENPELKNH